MSTERIGYGELVGSSDSIRKIYTLIEQVAPSSASVLITGESGTGKELVARTIHYMSPRREKPFVAINCSAIPETLMESELFGHEKGAFTGAASRRQGCFEIADTGTLLLDEIGEMPAVLQAKLLRVIEERAVRRLGSRKEIEVDVRLLAATNRQPQQAVSEGKLRDDLLYRLNVFSIHLPSLRERKEDLPILAQHLVTQLAEKHGPRTLSESIGSGSVTVSLLAWQRARASQRNRTRGDHLFRRTNRTPLFRTLPDRPTRTHA